MTKNIVIGKIEIDEGSIIYIRKDLIILDDDGTEITRKHLRTSYQPGDDITSEPQKIQRIANIIWTQQVIDDWKRRTENAKNAVLDLPTTFTGR